MQFDKGYWHKGTTHHHFLFLY